MSCNCLKELNDKLKEKFQHDNPEKKLKNHILKTVHLYREVKKMEK
ncbi:hypothetical protein [Clostridium tyrobutyricum]|nr:hypothetical protein [Clostridium tyrobutyricum]MBV4422953.1 hypothetical protein [Clostridium tyrobutyricum]